MLHNQDLSRQCPCGSKKPFRFCCEPAIEGYQPAATAEALMRSRYTAFALGQVNYLINTTATRYRNPDDATVLAEQIQVTTWTELKILAKEQGMQEDQTGIVEFIARFEAEGETAYLHEKSNFCREAERWVYLDGEVEIRSQPL